MNIKRLMEIGCYRGLRAAEPAGARSGRAPTRAREGPAQGAIAKKKTV